MVWRLQIWAVMVFLGGVWITIGGVGLGEGGTVAWRLQI